MAGRPRVVKADVERMRAQGMTLQVIADHFGVSRPAIWQALNRKTCRTNAAREPRPCACGCGQLHMRRKFATQDCYYAHLERTICDGKPFIESRWGCKQARRIVSELFDLQPHHIVHHVDRNDTNNTLANLWVFASHGDHMSHHRGGLAQPIWRGDGGSCGEGREHRLGDTP